MPEKAIDPTVVAPLREGALMLQAVAARLTALTTGVDEQVNASVGRLQAMPAAAMLDPFAVMAGAADVVAGTVAAGAQAAAAASRTTVAVRTGKPQAATAQAANTAVGAPSPAAQHRTAPRSASNEPSIASAIDLPARLLTRIAEEWAQSFQPAPGARQPLQSGAPQPEMPSALTPRGRSPSAHSEATRQKLREVMRRFGALHSTAPGNPASQRPGEPARTPKQNFERLLRRLLAGKSASAPDRAAQGRARSDRSARPAVDPMPSTSTPMAVAPAGAPARRAPSLLLGSAEAVAGAAAGLALPDAPAAPTGNSAVPSASGAAPQTDIDEVIAEINRLLVDQAWLRGVDLR